MAEGNHVSRKAKNFIVCPIFKFKLNQKEDHKLQISDRIFIRRITTDELVKMQKLPFSYFLGDALHLINSKTFVFEIYHDNFGEASRLVYEVF